LILLEQNKMEYKNKHNLFGCFSQYFYSKKAQLLYNMGNITDRLQADIDYSE